MAYPEGEDPVTPLQDAIKQAIPAAFTDLSGTDVITTSTDATLEEAAASVLPGVGAWVHLRLSSVTLSSGDQNVLIGTLAESLRPRIYFAPVNGWHSNGHASGLAQSGSGGVTVRWSSVSNSGALVLSGSWPV